MDTACELSTSIKALEGLLLAVEDLGFFVDFDAAHGEMQNGLHNGDVEGVVNVERQVMEESLAEGIFLLAFCNSIVGCECFLKGVFGAADVLSKLLTAHFLHEASARVVPRMEVEDIRGFGIEDKTNRPFL